MKYKNNPETIAVGSMLSCNVESNTTLPGYHIKNLVNGYGMSGEYNRFDTHDNHPEGATMWLGKIVPGSDNSIIFDFEGIYPLGEMAVWNFNSEKGTNGSDSGLLYGMKSLSIFTSIDKKDWTESKGAGFPYVISKASGEEQLKGQDIIDLNGVSARYVKIVPGDKTGKGNWGGEDSDNSMVVGLSCVRFYAGQGYLITEDNEWTDLLKRYKGWTGADGLFSIPYDGDERSIPNSLKKSLLIFSDTFIGSVDPVSLSRDFVMVNNTLAFLEGTEPDPERIKFIWRENIDKKPGTIFDPPGEDHFALEYKNYFWLQDGIIIDENLFVTALNVSHNEEGAEGMKFAIDGVSLIKCPLKRKGPQIDSYEVLDTPLYHEFEDGWKGYIGCGIFPNTERAGAPDPDGFIYIYGYKNKDKRSNLIVSRCPSDSYDDFSSWQYYDGSTWTDSMARCKVVAENVSHELSVSLMEFGPYKGKYILVFQKDIGGKMISCRIGDHPWGPFGEMIDLYECPEEDMGEGMLSYNAKAHPHLSKTGELLISYNVNSFSMETHHKNGEVYRPRFIKLKGIACGSYSM